MVEPLARVHQLRFLDSCFEAAELENPSVSDGSKSRRMVSSGMAYPASIFLYLLLVSRSLLFFLVAQGRGVLWFLDCHRADKESMKTKRI